VRSILGGTDSDVALALACFGGGSMTAAILLPRLLDRMADRPIMLLAFAAIASVPDTAKWLWQALLPTWTILGVAYSAVKTPSGRLRRRSARAADRPAVFAAQFALSHACWLLTGPLAGWLGSSAGSVPTLLVLAAITLVGVLIARRIWPASDADMLPHQHPELHPEHPRVQGEPSRHAHASICIRAGPDSREPQRLETKLVFDRLDSDLGARFYFTKWSLTARKPETPAWYCQSAAVTV